MLTLLAPNWPPRKRKGFYMDIIGVFKQLDWLLAGPRMDPTRIATMRIKPPVDSIEALAWEYHLKGMLRFIPDPSTIFKNAKEWVK
jgi:hypothetical protein